MTDEYFSVDRRGFYGTGKTLGLFKENPSGAPFRAEDWITENDLKSHIEKIFPKGLSLHGWDYITREGLLIHPNVNVTYVDYSLSLELLVEYVRRASFPKRPSRLQAYFAFSSLAEAQAFSARNRGKPIYRVTAARTFHFDQAWLRHGHQNAVASYAAHQYWAGASSPKPDWEHVLVSPMRIVGKVQ